MYFRDHFRTTTKHLGNAELYIQGVVVKWAIHHWVRLRTDDFKVQLSPSLNVYICLGSRSVKKRQSPWKPGPHWSNTFFPFYMLLLYNTDYCLTSDQWKWYQWIPKAVQKPSHDAFICINSCSKERKLSLQDQHGDEQEDGAGIQQEVG